MVWIFNTNVRNNETSYVKKSKTKATRKIPEEDRRNNALK